MGTISYPRTFLNKRMLLFPFLNEMGKWVETLGLVEFSTDLKPALENNLTNLMNIADEAHSRGWPKIPEYALENFKTIKPITIRAGTKIYRIVGLDNFKGCYWLNSLPSSELAFRKDYAVSKGWNGNGGYIEIEVSTDILAYEGIAIGQEISGKKKYILRGGGTQIWFPSNEYFSFDLESMQSLIKPTGW